MVGGWTYNDKLPDAILPERVVTAFSKAFEGFVGVKYRPVLYVGSQIVSGTNYCIICEAIPVTKEPIRTIKAVYIHEDLKGNAVITKIEDVIR